MPRDNVVVNNIFLFQTNCISAHAKVIERAVEMTWTTAVGAFILHLLYCCSPSPFLRLLTPKM